MAHEIEIINGVAKIAYAGEEPWHGLGKKVPPDLSPEQILKAAGLNWKVEKIPQYAMIGGKKVQSEWEALVRDEDNKKLSEVSRDWKPMQNIDAFNFFLEYCERGDMSMETAGSLRDGTIVWALAKVKDSFTILKKDRTDSYLLFINPHVYARGIEVRHTSIRVVCMNTMVGALSEKAMPSVKVGHKKEFDAERVKKLLGIAHMRMEGYKERASFLASKNYTKETLAAFMNTVFPVYQVDKTKTSKKELSKSAQLGMAVVETQPGAKFAPGSWWNGFNACTFLIDHVIGKTNETRLASAWLGQGNQRKVLALNEAVKAAETA